MPAILLVQILRVITELNKVSYCISADSEYFEVSAVPMVMML